MPPSYTVRWCSISWTTICSTWSSIPLCVRLRTYRKLTICSSTATFPQWDSSNWCFGSCAGHPQPEGHHQLRSSFRRGNGLTGLENYTRPAVNTSYHPIIHDGLATSLDWETVKDAYGSGNSSAAPLVRKAPRVMVYRAEHIYNWIVDVSRPTPCVESSSRDMHDGSLN